MAPSKADKKKKDKNGNKGDVGCDENKKNINKNICCVPKGRDS